MIAGNKEKYIGFDISVTIDEYEPPLGNIDSVRFMSSNLDSLFRNLVEVNGMVCKGCGSETDLTHVNENYVTYGICRKCQSASHWRLEINPIFDILRVGHTDVQFQLLLRKGVYPYKYVDDWEKLKERCLPQPKHSTANSTCWELVSLTTTMFRGFGESLG